MSVAIKTATKTLRERQAKLKPYLEEYERIQQAINSLSGEFGVIKDETPETTRKKNTARRGKRRATRNVRDSLDTAMPQLGTFTIRQLTETAGVSEASAYKYVRRQLADGVIVPDGERNTGGTIPATIYRYLPGDTAAI